MVNNPNSVPPQGSGPTDPKGPHVDGVDKKPSGSFDFGKSHKFLGMTFSEKDWNKLMNTLVHSFCDYINKRMQKATEKMKKGWKKERGDDDD